MNLFLCYTPLQLVLSLRIIENLKLTASSVDVFYVSKVDNLMTKNALHDLADYGCNVQFVHMKYKYPLYFMTILINFFKKVYSDVYVASVDNILVHFILSRIRFQQLYTFDDGTANIFPNSIYRQEVSIGIIGRVYRWLLGVHYSMFDIKQLSRLHYTIYDGYQNIVEPRVLISLASTLGVSMGCDSSMRSDSISATECNIMLGTVYSEIFESGTDVPAYLKNCIQIIQRTGLPTYYIPHPRERHIKLGVDWHTIDATHIAELEISSLLAEYQQIHLYGFVSSCQFNLATNPRVVNHVFSSVKLIPTFRQVIQEGFLPSSFDVVNIDSDC